MALTYNGISLGYVVTERIEQTPEKDPSGVDHTATRFVVRIRSILHPGVSPSNPGENPADAMVRIRHMLMTPRKTLTYTVNNKTVLSTSGRDDANGPETSCEYTQLNAGSFLVDFTVTVILTDCGNNPGSSYLSLKWSDTVIRDWQWLTTRRRVGTMVLSPLRTPDPDSMRPLVTPDVPTGFRRESADYTLSEDGRIIRFTFVDKEMMAPPPGIAVRMRGVQVESAVPPGSVKMGSIRLRLDGTKGVVKKDLLAAAVYSAMSRINASEPQKTPSGRLLFGWSVSEGLGDDECWVEVQVNWRIKPDKSRLNTNGAGNSKTASLVKGLLFPGLTIAGIAGRAVFGNGAGPKPDANGRDTAAISGSVPWLGADLPNVDPNRIVAPPANGLANAVKLIAAALNDPCGQTSELVGTAGGGTFDAELRTGGPAFGAGLAALNGNLPATASNSGTSALTAAVVPASAIPPDDAIALYGDDRPGVYDEYTLVAHYKDIPGIAVLASTKAGEPSRKVQMHNRRLKLTVEWSAAKVGDKPVIPAPMDSPDGLAIYTGGTVSPTELEVAADGVSTRYEITGIYEYEFSDPAKANVVAPLPPYLSCDLATDAARAVGFSADCIIFPNNGKAGVNPFNGSGMTDVDCCGSGTSTLVSTGVAGFNPTFGSGVNP
jgi:hypothetical protein